MPALATAERADLETGCLLAENRQIRLARDDVRAFIQYVIRDEETGEPIDLEPFQEDWHFLADKYDRLVLWAFMESGKTVNLSVARTLWELGRDPTLRFAIISGNEAKAAKICTTIAQYIESSEELHRVFPGLVPNPRMPWNTQQITVRRPTISKDPSVQVVGIGSDIQGARIDRAMLDDVLKRDNTRTDEMRKQTMDWYLKTIPGRLTARARVILIGNAFHPEDLQHELAKNPRFHAFKFPILRKDGSSIWPQRWPKERIEKRKEELGPVESMSQLMCEPISDALARFKREHINLCIARGEGRDLAFALRSMPPGFRSYCGVDLGIKRGASNALTTFFVLLIHPNGDRQVLWIESGRWLARQLLEKVLDYYNRFQSIFIVENNAAQDYLAQLIADNSLGLPGWSGVAIPILPFTTGKNKADPTFGLEAMSAEFAAGKWIIPSRGGAVHPEVQAWIDDMLGYSPVAHTGDRLMASWICKEGQRLNVPPPPPPQTGTVKLKLTKW